MSEQYSYLFNLFDVIINKGLIYINIGQIEVINDYLNFEGSLFYLYKQKYGNKWDFDFLYMRDVVLKIKDWLHK